MNYYFENEKMRKRLAKILDSWLGTPHRHHCAVKGKGVDCIHFVASVMVEAGIINSFHINEYPHDWHLHRGEEKFYNRLKEYEAAGILMEVGTSNPMDGDILLYRFGRVASHSGVFYEGRIYQALKRKVERRPFSVERHRLKFGFRALA